MCRNKVPQKGLTVFKINLNIRFFLKIEVMILGVTEPTIKFS